MVTSFRGADGRSAGSASMALHRYPVGPVVEAEIWAPAGTDIWGKSQVNRGIAPDALVAGEK